MRNKLQTSAAAPSDWHRVGQVAHDLTPDRKSVWGDQKVDSLAELLGQLTSYIYAARKFARSYEASQAEQFDAKLSWGQIVRLMAVNDNTRRSKLLRQCINKRWTLRQLDREIRGQVGRQRKFGQGGRTSPPPRNLSDALVQLESLLAAVVHWRLGLKRAALSEQPGNAKKSKSARSRKNSGLDLFPESLRREIDSTIDQVAMLRGNVYGALTLSMVR